MATYPAVIGAPAEWTPFVGRREDLSRLRRALSAHRLVSVVGPGGVGKTRLATEAVRARTAPVDVVWFVDLTAAVDTLDALSIIADRVGLGSTDIDALSYTLSASNCLLILDNAEHLLPGARAFIEQLLNGADGVRILVTTRRPVAIDCEEVVRLQPLRVGTLQENLSGAAWSEAVVLFVDRVRSIRGDYAPGAALPTVIKICELLDGLPLAIELAAVRMRAIGEDALLERLTRRFRALGATVAGPVHQRTLEQSIRWSFELCSPEEGRLWCALAVFMDRIPRDAALSVAKELGISGDLDGLLSSLANSSIITVDAEGGVRMLASIREFGRDQLHARAASRAHAAHLRWVRQRALESERLWYTSRHREIAHRSRADLSDMRAATEFAVGEGADPEAALDVLFSSWRRIWAPLGQLETFIRLLSAGVGLLHERDARWCDGTLLLLHLRGVLQGPQTVAEELAALREFTVSAGLHRCTLSVDAATAGLSPELSTPEPFQRLLDACVEHPEVISRGAVDLRLALMLDRASGGSAVEYAEGLIARSERVDEVPDRVFLLLGLSANALDRDDSDLAEGRARAALDIARATRMPHAAQAHEVLALLAARGGDFSVARSELASADEVWAAFGRSRVPVPQLAGVRAACDSLLAAAAQGPSATASTVGRAELASAPGNHPALTRREREVVALVGTGYADREIAEQLHLSVRTVEGHLQRAFTKLGIRSRRELRHAAAPPTPGDGSR